MIIFDIVTIFEYVLGLFLWWVAIYLIAQNPFNKITQIVFGFLVTVSFYFSSDVFFEAINQTHQYYLTGIVLKIFIWAMYLPPILIYHATYLLIPEIRRKLWQKISLYVVYAMAFVTMMVEIFTSLIRNYDQFSLSSYSGNFAEATGKYFFLIGILFMFVFILTASNLYNLMKEQPYKSVGWYKYFWPFSGMTFAALLGPFVLISYYGLIPHSAILPVTDFALIILPLTYSIIRYNLFIGEAKIIFGRTFYYSTLAIVSSIAIYLVVVLLTINPFTSVRSLVFPYILLYLLVATHPIYNWISTFFRDVIYNISSGHSIVTDDEVAQALREYHNFERLSESSLLRLSLVDQALHSEKVKAPVDALRHVLSSIIGDFSPSEDINRRIKSNMKYKILKMIAFDQAEEGQILWELGFDEYPVKILTQENKTRGPLFKITAPSDYSYKSRNAYIALKKEAIHDIVWRLSYLEKSQKSRKFL